MTKPGDSVPWARRQETPGFGFVAKNAYGLAMPITPMAMRAPALPVG